ncbi:MAG: hypothetical protein H6713_18795 [Myxococcales bacterium]|nr:hypothetical protein [Myxococcales bacterium]
MAARVQRAAIGGGARRLAALVVGVALAPVTARAQPEADASAAGLTIEWRAPAACPERAALRRRVGELVRAGAEVRDADARVDVEKTDDGFAATLRVRTVDGETTRALTGRDCAALVDAVAVIIAYAVDPVRSDVETPVVDVPPPDRALPDAPPSSTPDEAVAPTPEEPAPAPTPARVERNVSRDSTARGGASSVETDGGDDARPDDARPDGPPVAIVQLGAGLGGGPLPSVGARVAGRVGARIRRARLEVTGEYWLTRPGVAELDARARGRFSLWTVGARGGYTLATRRLELPLVVGVEAGVLRGAGEELVVSRTSQQAWVAVTAAAGLSWEFVRGFGLWLEVGGALPLRRPGFAVQSDVAADELLVVHRAAALAGVVTAGVELRFRGRRGASRRAGSG